jgi:NAD+ synthase (glutamine-hydrolysing)
MPGFIVPSSWEAEAALLRERAAANGMLVAMANQGAPAGGMASAGRSSIWDERGELVLQLEPSGPSHAPAIVERARRLAAREPKREACE